MEQINDTHRGYPRTLVEAFGPHCCTHITDPDQPDWQDGVVYAGVLIAALLGLILIATGVIV